ncbi:MAG: hypothetical protein U9P12_09160 [Verrucomicrobiota bacterium]|nr:hypothetical protein [Verrucomicrobiota bacterium]
MKRMMSIAAIALFMAGTSVLACNTCGCKGKKADKKAECSACSKDKEAEAKKCGADSTKSCSAKKGSAKK